MASSLHPALKGKIGDTEYFLVVMPARWVTANLTIPSEMDGWDDETIDEKYQRKINYSRVEGSIAPYLANDPQRFFGSLIVTVQNDEKMAWEPLTRIVRDIPGAYEAEASEVGFLRLTGQEVMVPLDGQHRLAAMKFAISGKNQRDEPIDGVEPSKQVAADLVTLMLIRHDIERARKIFNKVNRYARPTSKADNLITSDDDFLAILSREIATQSFHPRLVNVSTNTIAAKSEHVTTLGTIYSILSTVLAEEHPQADRLPDQAQQVRLRKRANQFFEEFIKGSKTIAKALLNPGPDGDERRVELREVDLLMKPVVQHAACAAVHELHARGTSTSGIKLGDAFARLSNINWHKDNSDWQGVLLNGDKVISGQTARRFATRFIAYQIGARLEPAEIAELGDDLLSVCGRSSGRTLPIPVPG